MNTSLHRSILVVGALVVGMAAGVAADRAWQEARGQRGPGTGPPPFPLFNALDADHDGAISIAEIADGARALNTLDKNGDAKLGPEEIRPAFGRGEFGGRRGEGRGEPGETAPPSPDDLVSTLMAFDADKDGTLAQAEVPARMQGLFERADGDKDGKLTATELKSLASAQSNPSAGMGPGGPEGGRRGRGPGEGGRRDPLTAALDTNRDGTISPDEIAAAPEALKKLDADGDGRLTVDEVRPAFGRGRGERNGSDGGDRR